MLTYTKVCSLMYSKHNLAVILDFLGNYSKMLFTFLLVVV